MNWKTIHWKLATIALIAALLSGCQVTRQALEPTVDTQPTYAAIQTQAVQTAVAQMTLLAPTAAPVLPTEPPVEAAPTEPAPTDIPTEAPTAIPSFTSPPPTAIPTATFIPRTATPYPTATSSSYSCTITELSPEFGYDMRAGGDFDGRWEVKNTGSETWEADDVDVRYISGTEFHDRVDAFDLPEDISKGETYTVVVDMLAPDSPGRYTTYWAIMRGSQTLCSLPLTIDVK